MQPNIPSSHTKRKKYMRAFHSAIFVVETWTSSGNLNYLVKVMDQWLS